LGIIPYFDNSFYLIYSIFADEESIVEELKPLTISHTAITISYRPIGSSKTKTNTDKLVSELNIPNNPIRLSIRTNALESFKKSYYDLATQRGETQSKIFNRPIKALVFSAPQISASGSSPRVQESFYIS
jgi:hypothetical protein